MKILHKIFCKLVAIVLLGISSVTIAAEPKIGIVLLHGNGHPTALIGELAHKLEAHNFLVAHPEMPYSKDRRYDKDVDSAVKQVDDAFSELKAKGATKFFIAGHSKGGVFAVYYASNHPVDGLIAISPGASAASKVMKTKLGKSIKKAKRLIKEGEGNKPSEFEDYEGGRGITDLRAPAEAYFSWFNPAGAMNSKRAVKAMSDKVPVLWIVAKNDYPGLRKVNIPMFELLPANPKSKLYQPDTNHKNAPTDSADEIIKWITDLAR